MGELDISTITDFEGVNQRKKSFLEKVIKDILLKNKNTIKFGDDRTIVQYNDGSEELVLNQEEDNQSKMLEEILNNPITKEIITSKDDILGIDSSIEEGSFSADYLALVNEISATSISDGAFKREVEEMKEKSRQL